MLVSVGMLLLLSGNRAGAQALQLPPGEDPAAWEEALAAAGVRLGDAEADLRLEADPWVLRVSSPDGRERVLPVARPLTEVQRLDLLYLALSLRQPSTAEGWQGVPAPPPEPVSLDAQPLPARHVSPPVPLPPPVAPIAPTPPAAPPPPDDPPPAPAAPVAAAPPAVPDTPAPPAAVAAAAPHPPRRSLPMHILLGAGPVTDPALNPALHMRGGLALDPTDWLRLAAEPLVTTRRQLGLDRSWTEAGVGLQLAHRRGGIGISLGADLRWRSFFEADRRVARGLVPVGEVGVSWTLPGTTADIALVGARDLRSVLFFEGPEQVGELSPWGLRAALVVAVPLRRDQPGVVETPWP